MENLTEQEAFRSMYYYLEDYYKRTAYDEIGGILSDLSLLEDSMPADPAAWEDWKKAVERAKKDSESVKLKFVKTDD